MQCYKNDGKTKKCLEVNSYMIHKLGNLLHVLQVIIVVLQILGLSWVY